MNTEPKISSNETSTSNNDTNWSILNETAEKDKPEQPISSDVYQEFAQYMFGKLTEELQDDNNQNPIAQAKINNEIAIVFPLMGKVEDFEPITPTELFDGIHDRCLAEANEAQEKGHTNQARSYKLQAAATENIRKDFYDYMSKKDEPAKDEPNKPPTNKIA